MDETIPVATGIEMPFFPMRPRAGAPIKPGQARTLLEEIQGGRWIAQRKANGHRACLAVVDGKVWIQNRHGAWFKLPVRNTHDFLKLPNRTCFDGEVIDREFCPFDCLALRGRTMIFDPADERATVAFQLVKFLGHEWRFADPTPQFIRAGRRNLPDWEGLVLKETLSSYVMLARPTQQSQTWVKRRW
jgi:ATP-dependent DNA ligase